MQDQNQTLEEYLDKQIASVKIGDVVEGTIVKIGEEFSFVDIGLKAEAILPTKEIYSDDGGSLFKEGDRIKVAVVGRDRDTGSFLLSYSKLKKEEAQKAIKEAYEKGLTVKVKVTNAIKGGYRVRFMGAIEGFLPFSQSYFKERPASPEELLGKILEVEVIQLKDRDFVVSYRKVAEKEYERQKQQVIEKIQSGEVLSGIVRKSVKGGFLVEIEGVIMGYLPYAELSWERIKDPASFLKEGDEVKVKPIFWDPGKERLKLSIKATLPDPWDGIEYRYSVGDKVKGQIVQVFNFGAFAEIEPGVEGLIPASEICWGKRVKPEEVLKEGDSVEALILELNPHDRKMLLSLRRLEPSPWERFTSETKKGDVVIGKVVKIMDYGAFVELSYGVKGFLHISNVSWSRVRDIKEKLEEGKEYKFKVLDFDPKKQRVELSLKHLKPDPWKEIEEQYKIGDVVEGSVAEVFEKGLRLEVLPDVYCFVPASEAIEGIRRWSGQRIKEALEEKFKPGDKVKVKITELAPEERRFVGSYLKYKEEVEKASAKEFLKTGKKGVITLGELLKQKLGEV